MRNCLFATASLAFVSSPALAADKLSVGVGGYMQQWFGMSSVDDTEKDKAKMKGDGVAQQSDSEIFFRGKLETDSGLTFSVKVELEGNSGTAADGKNTGVIDESQLTIGGEFGKITLGAEDPASTLTHHGGLDVGISLNCGDTHKWINGLAGCSHNGFGTYGHGHGDKNQVMYFSPRVSGVQFGVSYIPDSSQEGGNNDLNDNMKDAWSVGGNYVGEFGDGLNIAFSLGHYQGSQADEKLPYITGAAPVGAAADKRITVAKLKADMKSVNDYKAAQALMLSGKAKTLSLLGTTDNAGTFTPTDGGATAAFNKAAMAQNNILAATDGMAMKADDKTFSNAALQVSVGSFSFGVVYATADGGGYTTMNKNMVVNANDPANRADYLVLLNEDTAGSFQSADGTADGTITSRGTVAFTSADRTTAIAGDQVHLFNAGTKDSPKYVVESAANNDPSNDLVMQKIVKDGSKDWDTWGAGVKYTDGPMAVSLSHLATEWDNGDEQEASMLSVSYTLAPGVASKSSIFMGERTMGKRKIDGTGFVTGIVIGF